METKKQTKGSYTRPGDDSCLAMQKSNMISKTIICKLGEPV